MRLSLALGSLALLSVLGLARAADEPGNATTDDARWSAAIDTFAGTLNGTIDRSELDKLVAPHSWVAPFARNRSEAVTVLPERLAGLTLVGAHGYLQPSISAASDVIADVSANAAIAPSVKKRIVPAEGTDPRVANATMARWFATALDAQPGDPVAIVVLYDPGQAVGDVPATPQLVLVLARGEFDATGKPTITRVLYGTLDAAVK